ncbi:MAG: glycoside hydrolase family 130 protein [Acidobacteriota bacterium]
MTMSRIEVERLDERFASDEGRVITRFWAPATPRHEREVIGRLLDMSEHDVREGARRTIEDFRDRHRDIERVLLAHERLVHDRLRTRADEADLTLLARLETSALSHERRLLLGATFTQEYAVEAAAYFNPSIVPHPDQSGVPAGGLRYVLSFRAVGEGHLSSIVFRSGLIEPDGTIEEDPVGRFAERPEVIADPSYDRHTFALKLRELDAWNVTSAVILQGLPEQFELSELERSIAAHRQEFGDAVDERTLRTMLWLAESNYAIRFEEACDLSERVLFPVSRNETRGMEDARFVRVVDDGDVVYYATYTANNGFTAVPQLIETRDFLQFKIITLNGRSARGKGLALFPRRIGGRWAMLGRQDGENLTLMFSDNLHFWHEHRILLRPREPWESVLIGNCGSPLETDAGWLVLTHGVGPMRRYVIGAALLDRDDPSRVLGRLREPLLTPAEHEREGYVPNVVYSCGGLIHGERLYLPYAMSDTSSAMAVIGLEPLLDALLAAGP